jgi:hypothetical protein
MLVFEVKVLRSPAVTDFKEWPQPQIAMAVMTTGGWNSKTT